MCLPCFSSAVTQSQRHHSNVKRFGFYVRLVAARQRNAQLFDFIKQRDKLKPCALPWVQSAASLDCRKQCLPKIVRIAATP
jgi:hypothetical protein